MKISNDSGIWFWNRIAMYKVNNGTASEWYSYETRNVDFYDDKHYSLEYSYSLEQSNPNEDACSYIPPKWETDIVCKRDGNRTTMDEQTQEIHFLKGEEIDFYPQKELKAVKFQFKYSTETIRRIITNDEATELPLLQTSVKHTVIYNLYGSNHESSHTEDKRWALELTEEKNGVKTYKYYDTASGGRGIHNIYKARDGVILEEKSCDENGMLSMLTTYSFPDNTLIRERLPKFTIAAYESAGNPPSNSRQSVEVISADDKQMTLRTKILFDNVLYGQHDTRYARMKIRK